METSPLTFVTLNERIEALPEHASYQFAPNRRAKWGYALVGIAGALILILGRLLPSRPWVAFLLLTLLALEIAGLVLAITADLSSFRLTLAHQRREFAEALDFDMPHHEVVVAWLRSFPLGRLEAMSDFAGHRVERFRNKLSLLTGGVEKLGALPVLVAVVVQFKDMRWPPQPSWTQVILFGALMFFYWLCVLTLSQRFRLELYDSLLKKAMATLPK